MGLLVLCHFKDRLSGKTCNGYESKEVEGSDVESIWTRAVAMARGRMTIALDQNTTAEKMKTFAFQRLIATKFNEEMATQLPGLTAHEFLDCGYGRDIGKYIKHEHDRLDTGRRSLPLAPKKRLAKSTRSTTMLPSHKARWDWSEAKTYGSISKGINGDTTF